MSEQLWAALRIKPALTESEPTPKWVSEHTRSGRIPMLWSGDPKDHGFNGPVVPVTLIETAELDALRAATLARMWINQPSTHQKFHHLHGVNVLAQREYGDTYRVYFISGDVINQQMPREALSVGWRVPKIIKKGED